MTQTTGTRTRACGRSRPPIGVSLGAILMVAAACSGAPTPTAGPSAAAIPPSPTSAVSPSPASVTAPSPSASVAATVTLGESSCVYEGPGAVDVGALSISMVTAMPGQFDTDLWRMNPGHTYDELVAHFDEERRRDEAGEPGLGHPTFATLAAQGSAIDGRGQLVTPPLDPGTYGIACILFGEGERGGIWAAGPFEVSLAPVARGYHALVDVPGDLGVVVFGGFSGPPPDGRELTDTWSFAADRGWQDLAPDPAAPVTDRGVLIGESGMVLTDLGGTRVLDPADPGWKLVGTQEPEVNVGGRLVYDSESDKVLLFTATGATWATSTVATWAYDHDIRTWTRMNPRSSPSARGWPAMAYDSASDRVVLFGGGNDVDDLGDTWSYDLNTDTWQELQPAVAPDPRSYSAMAYDPASDRMILFGGAAGPCCEEVTFNDTWAYDVDTNTWTELAPSYGPNATGWHAMALEADTGQIVLFGGGPDREHYRADTWLLDPGTDTWSQVE